MWNIYIYVCVSSNIVYIYLYVEWKWTCTAHPLFLEGAQVVQRGSQNADDRQQEPGHGEEDALPAATGEEHQRGRP